MATKKVAVNLTPERVSLGPGETAEFVATVHNTSDVVEAYSIDVQGIDTAWSRLSVTSLSLFPGDKETVRIQVSPPVSSSAKAGSYPVSVRVISKRDPAIGTIASFILDLGKISDYCLDLSPKRTRGRKGPFQLAITNNGNTVTTYKLEAFDPEDVCEFRFKSDTVAVDPGTTKKTPLVVDPKKKPFTGAPRSFGFSVKATPLEGEPKEVEGELECRALLPKWAVAAIIVAVVAVVGLIVVLVMTAGKTPQLPIDADFELAAGDHQAYTFELNEAVTIQAIAGGSGTGTLQVILLGPDGRERQRVQGAGQVRLNYTVLDSDLRRKGNSLWKLYLVSFAQNATIKGELTVETAENP